MPNLSAIFTSVSNSFLVSLIVIQMSAVSSCFRLRFLCVLTTLTVSPNRSVMDPFSEGLQATVVDSDDMPLAARHKKFFESPSPGNALLIVNSV